MSSEEEHANNLAAARRAVEEAQVRVKFLTDELGGAMTENDNKQAGVIHRDCKKAKRELARLEEELRALEEGQSPEA
ncbi:MAG: hypothetical protein L0H73_15765 [Nitrococcus sp.]|nr:hypothetical protein [Nitrococcus sp.]